MSIILRKFNIKYISDSSLILIIGSNNSNKSYITKDLLYNHNTIPIGAVISKNKYGYEYIPPIFIHEEYNKKIIKNIIKNKISSFLVFDNYNGEELHPKKLKNTLTVLTIDYYIYKNISLRNNIEYLFILREDLHINRKKIYDAFLKMEFTLFCKLLDEYTDDNNVLVIHLKSDSSLIQDKFFWYGISKTSQPYKTSQKNDNPFKMCCEEAWKYNETHLIKTDNLDNLDNNKLLFNRNFLF